MSKKQTCTVCGAEIGDKVITLNDAVGYRAKYCQAACFIADAEKRGVVRNPQHADLETLTGDDKLLR